MRTLKILDVITHNFAKLFHQLDFHSVSLQLNNETFSKVHFFKIIGYFVLPLFLSKTLIIPKWPAINKTTRKIWILNLNYKCVSYQIFDINPSIMIKRIVTIKKSFKNFDFLTLYD